MEWINQDLGMKDCLLEFAETEQYKFQAEIVKLEPIFGGYYFGNFELSVTVFDLDGKQVEALELNGLNGKFKGALKQLQMLKDKASCKYNSVVFV